MCSSYVGCPEFHNVLVLAGNLLVAATTTATTTTTTTTTSASTATTATTTTSYYCYCCYYYGYYHCQPFVVCGFYGFDGQHLFQFSHSCSGYHNSNCCMRLVTSTRAFTESEFLRFTCPATLEMTSSLAIITMPTTLHSYSCCR